MSAVTQSLKNSAEDTSAEEPSAKKAKVAGGEAGADNKAVDNNNKSTANKQVDNNNTNTNDAKSKADIVESTDNAKIPTKVANGNDSKNKEPESSDKRENNNDEPDDDDDDGPENDNEDDDGSNTFDPVVASQLEAVEEIQSQISKLNELASEEILKVEQKYNKLRRPHFEKRNTLLKAIPNFWVTTLGNHPLIAPMINSHEDEDCLHYMVNLEVDEYEDIKSGYKLNFHFVENPYISNKIVSREIRHVNSDEVVACVTQLNYKLDTPQGKNLKALVETSIAQRQRNGRLQNSFFGWLTCPVDESGTDEIAEMIKDQIWPSPLEFFFSAPEDYVVSGSDESDEEEDYDEEADHDVDQAEIEDYLDDELENDDDANDEDDGDVAGDDDDEEDDDDDDDEDEEENDEE